MSSRIVIQSSQRTHHLLVPPWPQVFDNKVTEMIDRQVSPAFTRWSAIIIALYQHLPRVSRYYRSLAVFTPCTRESWQGNPDRPVCVGTRRAPLLLYTRHPWSEGAPVKIYCDTNQFFLLSCCPGECYQSSSRQ